MHNGTHDTLPDREWIRLRRWSDGYDAGFAKVVPNDFPPGFRDDGEYIAGFAQGLKDRRVIDAELPPRG